MQACVIFVMVLSHVVFSTNFLLTQWLYMIYHFYFQVNLPVNIMAATYPGQNHNQLMYNSDDLPKTVARTLIQGSNIMSMDFHPIQQTVLLGQPLFYYVFILVLSYF